MLFKYLAPALAATILLTGITATPAQALTGFGTIPTPTSTSTPELSQQSPEPTSSAAPEAIQPSTLSRGTTLPESPAPEPAPTQSSAPSRVPAPALKVTVATGDLVGKTMSVSKRTGKRLQGVILGAGTASGRYFEVQSYNEASRSWKTISSGYSTTGGAWSAQISPTTEDKQILRLAIPNSDETYAAYTGPSTTVSRIRDKFTVNTNKNPATIHSVPWDQKEFKFWTSIYSDGFAAQLERYDGKKWVKVSSLTTTRSQYQYSFKLPLGNSKSKDTTVKYRVNMPATTYYEASISKVIDVRWENPKLYKGAQKTAYSYTAKYCPAVMIRFDSKLNKAGAWGKAQLGDKPKLITLYTKIPSKHLKTVALHECSHFYQWNAATNSNNKGWDAYKAASNKLMGTKNDLGMERVNECMSATWGGHTYWTYGASAKLCSQAKVKDFVQKSLKGQKVT